jgi:thiol peroxidase
VGHLPAIGSRAPDFQLVAADLSTKTLSDFAGKKKILTINPSYDTGVCQKAAHNFNEKVSGRSDAVVLLVSADLPFAQ